MARSARVEREVDEFIAVRFKHHRNGFMANGRRKTGKGCDHDRDDKWVRIDPDGRRKHRKKSMEIREDFAGRVQSLAAVFRETFAASKGDAEGDVIGALALDLMASTASPDIHVFSGHLEGAITGCIIFSRLRYPDDPRSVFVLGPVAVAPPHQKRGIGKALISHGLAALRAGGVDVALVYGDPAYYGKLAFVPVTEADAAAPFTLQHPEGWQVLSLNNTPFVPLKGPSSCVAAFDDPAFW